MRIFVLEDDFSQQTRIETTIEKLLKEHHITPSSFEVFGKPDQLLAEVHEKGAHQLFFLDIEIRNEEMKGLEVARKIREQDPYALIVFVTTHSEFMPLSFRYQVSALDYIDKALSTEGLNLESRQPSSMPIVKIVKVWRKIAFTLNQNLPNFSILLKRFTISKHPQDPIVLFSIPRQTGWNLQRV
ncbi:response regulator [Streptococcus pneumoniae]|nr:response regulator [Streptococcus pneumoniae]